MTTARRGVRTPAELRAAGLAALLRELGPVGMVRFLQELETGRGDYTTERDRWLAKQDVRELAQAIRAGRAAREPSVDPPEHEQGQAPTAPPVPSAPNAG